MNETECYKLFIKKLDPEFCSKLHGNQFQSGLPDLIFAKEGKHWFLEFKIVSGESLPWSKCRLGQHLTMRQMWKANMPVWYVVYSTKTEEFYALSPEEVQEGRSTKLDNGRKIGSMRILLGLPTCNDTH